MSRNARSARESGFQPPRQAFADLPPLPKLPTEIDPNRWLIWIDQKAYQRRVSSDGTVQLGKQRYYVQRQRHKELVLLRIDAPERQLEVLIGETVLKTIPLKGLPGEGLLPFDRYLELIIYANPMQ